MRLTWTHLDSPEWVVGFSGGGWGAWWGDVGEAGGEVTVETYVNPVLLRQEIGRRVRSARKCAGLNLEDAARRLEIGSSTLPDRVWAGPAHPASGALDDGPVR